MSSGAPSAHLTVLAAPAVERLVTDPDGVYVDATFGRGGHSRLILSRLSARGRLIALDRDPQAAEAAAAIADRRFHFAHTRFSRLSATLAGMGALLVTDAAFQLKGRYEFDCSLGIVGLPDGRFLAAGGRSDKGKGCTGNVRLAVPDEKSGFKFVARQRQP